LLWGTRIVEDQLDKESSLTQSFEKDRLLRKMHQPIQQSHTHVINKIK